MNTKTCVQPGTHWICIIKWMHFKFLNLTFVLIQKTSVPQFCFQLADLQQTSAYVTRPLMQQRLKFTPPSAECVAASTAALRGARLVEEHTVRKAAAAWYYWAPRACQPPHRIHVRPKAVSPCCFYPRHTHMHSQTHQTSLCALWRVTDKELLFFNSINLSWLIYSTEHLHILQIHPEMRLCFMTLRTWT